MVLYDTWSNILTDVLESLVSTLDPSFRIMAVTKDPSRSVLSSSQKL